MQKERECLRRRERAHMCADFVHRWIDISDHIYNHVCLHVYVNRYIQLCVYDHMIQFVYMHIIYIYMYIYIYIYVCVCVCVCVCVYNVYI